MAVILRFLTVGSHLSGGRHVLFGEKSLQVVLIFPTLLGACSLIYPLYLKNYCSRCSNVLI